MAHYKFDFVDLISASLQAIDKRESDENNNDRKADEKKSPTGDEEKQPKDDEVVDEKLEKIKPKQMVGLFPLDLRSELMNRVGGKAGFSLKKSTTNVDVLKVKSDPIPIRLPDRPTDLLKALQAKDIRKKTNNDDSDDEGGQEKLSFKEKLQLIERSSSRNLVNPL